METCFFPSKYEDFTELPANLSALWHDTVCHDWLKSVTGKMWLGFLTRWINVATEIFKDTKVRAAPSLQAGSTYGWPPWPFWEKSLPLDRAVAARQQNTPHGNSLQMPGTGSFQGEKWKPFTLAVTWAFDSTKPFGQRAPRSGRHVKIGD